MLVFHGFWNEKRILTHFRRTLISRRIYGVGLKVATKQAAKEMIDSPAVAVPGMPLNGRAYLLVGTGSRFEYFQSPILGQTEILMWSLRCLPRRLRTQEDVTRSSIRQNGIINREGKTAHRSASTIHSYYFCDSG